MAHNTLKNRWDAVVLRSKYVRVNNCEPLVVIKEPNWIRFANRSPYSHRQFTILLARIVKKIQITTKKGAVGLSLLLMFRLSGDVISRTVTLSFFFSFLPNSLFTGVPCLWVKTCGRARQPKGERNIHVWCAIFTSRAPARTLGAVV